jgi:hypothetical protein
MENVECNVVYVDRSVAQDRSVKAGEQNSDRDTVQGESPHVAENARHLLDVFDEGMHAVAPPTQSFRLPWCWMDLLTVDYSLFV